MNNNNNYPDILRSPNRDPISFMDDSNSHSDYSDFRLPEINNLSSETDSY